jgi:hypothetical protein
VVNSIRVNRELDSNETDESALQCAKHEELRTSTVEVITMD